jgi:hypothetical protein
MDKQASMDWSRLRNTLAVHQLTLLWPLRDWVAIAILLAKLETTRLATS